MPWEKGDVGYWLNLQEELRNRGTEGMELVLQRLMGGRSGSSRESPVPLHRAEAAPGAGKAKPAILSLQLPPVTAANWLWNMDEVILWLHTDPPVMTWTPWWDDPVTRYPVKQLTSQQMFLEGGKKLLSRKVSCGWLNSKFIFCSSAERIEIKSLILLTTAPILLY